MATFPLTRNTNNATLELLENRWMLSTYWVSPNGNNGYTGGSDAPFQTITYALTKATQPGDTVLVKDGLYRGERAVFPANGTSSNPITLAAAPGESPILRGSAEVKGWTLESGAVYSAGWTKYFGAWNTAFTSEPQGNTAGLDARSKARNQFFADGKYLEEVPRKVDLKSGSFWIDRAQQTVYLWLADSSDPHTHLIEGADTQDAMLRTNGKDHLQIRGLTFEQSSNAAQGFAMARIDAGGIADGTSDHVVAENIVARLAAGAGFGMTGNNNVLRNSELADNGQLGLHAGGTGTNNRVEGGRWLRNNTLAGKQYNIGWEAGGCKVTRSRDFVVDGVEAAYNRGRGIWFDADNRDAIIRNSRAHHNLIGLHYEISYTATIYNNLFYQNVSQGDVGVVGIGVHIASSPGCRIYNNTFFGNEGQGVSVSSEGAFEGGTKPLRVMNGLDMSSYATRVYNNIVSDNQWGQYKLSFAIETNPPIPKEITDGDPSTNPIVPWSPNTSDYNLFHLADTSPIHPNGYPYPRKFFSGNPMPEPTPQYRTASEWITRPLADWQARTGWDTHSLWNQDPKMADPYGIDFHLTAGSPAIGAGLYQPEARIDRDGEARSATRTDIGAYQAIIANEAPTIAEPAGATPGNVAGTTTELNVLGADDGGEAALSYLWSATGPAAITFTANGTNSAKSTTATFAQAGVYEFMATITDGGQLSRTSTVQVTVDQTLTAITTSPATATVTTSATRQFTATAQDQFGMGMTSSFTWNVASGGGTISSNGLYTAPGTAGTAIVRASSGGVSSTANVTITAASPAAPTNMISTKIGKNKAKLTWKDNSTDETGFTVWSSRDGVTWAQYKTVAPVAGTGGTVTYSTGTLTSGKWFFKTTAQNAAGRSADSNVVSLVV